jgi:hypothetical protein
LAKNVHTRKRRNFIMSAKMGKRETAKKPSTTRRHDSLATGAFGRDKPSTKSGQELNQKVSGQRSTQHSKYTRRAADARKRSKQ